MPYGTERNGYKDEKIFILEENKIESIYSEDKKVFARTESNEIFEIKKRIYELETGMYNENGELKSFEQIKQRVKLDENDIISMLNVLKNKEELEIMDSYLKNLNTNLIDENFSYYIKY